MPASEAIPIAIPNDGVATTNCSGSVDDFFSRSLDTLNDVQNMDKITCPTLSSDDSTEKTSSPLPVPEVCGEALEASVDTLTGQLYLTQYRIIIVDRDKTAIANIPLVTVDSIETRDVFVLQINCKYGRVFKVTAEKSETACEWFKKLSQKTVAQRSVNDVFAWRFAKAAKQQAPCWLKWDASTGDVESCADDDFIRLGFNAQNWRISNANKNFELCETYPPSVIVPKAVTDEELRSASEGRFLSRFPVAVWRCKEKDTVLLRSSQPRVGLFSYRYAQDERILDCVWNAMPEGLRCSRVLIIDARSYAAAWANRAKGGGFESDEYYKHTEIKYLGLPNIHNIRYSFHQLRALLAAPRDQVAFLQSLQTTQWLHYLTSLLESAHECVRALHDEGRSVLVHCSDGWDRTTQIISLAKLMADPYYRTIEGFKCLIRRDWIDFGHKFGDRTGLRNSDPNERSPVFLQWLDCVYQLHCQFPTAFEFTTSYLTKLAQHCYSGLFGTFLWNSLSERRNMRKDCNGETLSVWSYLNGSNRQFVNVVYEEPRKSSRRLRPSLGVEHIVLWKQLYMGPRLEQLINAPEELHSSSSAGLIGSQHSEADRCSLNRAHSAESLSNIDGAMTQSTSGSIHGNNHQLVHAVSTRSSISNDAEQRNDETDTLMLSSVIKPFRKEHLAREVDVDGLTKISDVYQDKARKKLEEKEAEIRSLKQKIIHLENERRRYPSGLEYSPQNGSKSFGDESSDSCPRSLESVSGISIIDKDDASDISEGSKGWTLDAASQYCMNCQQPFHLNNRRHHCRNCGKLFCGTCTEYKYHRVHDSKGEHVRVCYNCYTTMTRASGCPIIPPIPTSSQQNRTPTHKSAQSPFVIGSANGQTVFG